MRKIPIKLIGGLLIAVGFLVLVTHPLVTPGFIPTHDGEYHIIRYMDFYRMLSQGNLFPRWSPTINSGYGLPLFMFHYPFPNYVGSFFHVFGINFVESFKLSLALGYIVGFIAVYFWLNKLFSKKAALVGAVASSCVPYWYLNIYIRGSVGEIWAIAFVLLTFAAIEHKRRTLLACAVGCMIISHNITTMVAIPLILVYAWIRNRSLISWIAIGIGLVTYFWLPALVEQKYMVGLTIVNPLDHFASLYELLIPSWGSGFSSTGGLENKMSFQIGIVPISLGIIACISLLRSRKQTHHMMGFGLGAAAIIIAYCMMSVSAFVWKWMPGLSLIQYPWRLLWLFIPITAYTGGFVAHRFPSWWVESGIIVCSILAIFSYTRPAMYQPRDDAYYQSRANFTDGTSSMGNTLSTIWTPWKQHRSEKAMTFLSGSGDIQITKHTFTSISATVTAHEDSRLEIHTLYFPGWNAYVDGMSIPIDYATGGTILIPISKGIHEIRVKFSETPIRVFADSVSFGCLALLVVFSILPLYKRHYSAVCI